MRSLCCSRDSVYVSVFGRPVLIDKRIKVLDEIEPKDEPKFQRRRKRDLKPQKAIEIAVFVDDDLYKKTVEDGANNPEVEIQNLVFAYMNSVSANFFYTTDGC